MSPVKSLALAAASALVGVTLAFAQASDTGSLRGRITDGTGAALPGVTVTASSPAVMGGSLTTLTASEGLYRFPSLPPGVYEIRMDLPGFKPISIPNLRINVGLGLTIDRVLEISTVEETVTVVGESPIVDTKNTGAGAVVTNEILAKIPSARDLWNTMQQVPGLVVPRENVGGFESTQLGSMQVHGSGASSVQHNVNGVDMTLMHQDNIGAGYYSTDAYEEIQVTTSGISAEHSRGGLIINQVFRSGSNQFRGLVGTFFENSDMQTNNIDDTLRQRGVTTSGAPLDYLFEFSAQGGGPILRDRLWFFVAFREYDVFPFVLNCFKADGSQCTDEAKLQTLDSKWNTQIGPNNRLMFLYAWGRKFMPNRDISQFVRPEASYHQDGRHEVGQAKYERILGSNALMEINYGQLATPFPLAYRDSTGDKTTAFDEITRVRFDAPLRDFFQRGRMRTIGGNFTYFQDRWLGGSHDFKTGVEHRQGAVPQEFRYNGDLERRYLNGVPYRVIVYNSPIEQDARNYSWAGYVQDSMRFGRVSVNAGLRVEWWRGDLPAQSNNPRSFPAIFGGAQTFPESKGIMEWTTYSPRVGVVYDIAGDSKTVLKATFGRYYSQIEGNRINSTANRNGLASATFDWVDLNGNNYPDYPSEFGTLRSLNLPSRKTIEAGIKSPYSDEVSFSVERGLTQRTSISARYTYRKNNRILAETDLGLPDEAFSIASTATDPLTGNLINYWSLGPAYSTVVNDVVLTQFDSNWTRYHGVDLVFDRRFDGRWLMRASLTIQDNYGRKGGYSNRNDREIFPYGAKGLDARTMAKIMGT